MPLAQLWWFHTIYAVTHRRFSGSQTRQKHQLSNKKSPAPQGCFSKDQLVAAPLSLMEQSGGVSNGRNNSSTAIVRMSHSLGKSHKAAMLFSNYVSSTNLWVKLLSPLERKSGVCYNLYMYVWLCGHLSSEHFYTYELQSHGLRCERYPPIMLIINKAPESLLCQL